MMIGTPGAASDTGYVPGKWIDTIVRGGPPFNRPTDVAIAPNGELYVSDGYGNARVHRFTADGKLIQSWGEPGSGPGQFMLPHGIWVAADGRVFVADRENDRIQIFSPSGEFLAQWTHVQRPTDICIGRDRLVYVSELTWLPGQRSYTKGVYDKKMPGRVSVLDLQGNVLARWGGEDGAAPGNFWAPHTICVDSRGDIYVGEVTYTFSGLGKAGQVPEGCHTFQKFAREG
jgi:sugar lactone lactonase YvrE